MKALKEKRVSLRSYLRRGLVILSLFALVFASCGDSGGGDEPSVPTNGTGGGVVTGPKIKSVTILSQPIVESFQGLPPELKGLSIEVEWYDRSIGNNGKEIVYYGVGGNEGDFGTVPGYCDTAWENALTPGDPSTYGKGAGAYLNGNLQLVYKGQVVPTDKPLTPPMVVAATAIQITQKTPIDWYADTRPDFDGLTYNVIFEAGWLGLGAKSVKDVRNDYKFFEHEMTAAYPKAFYKDAGLDKRINVYIGQLPAGLGGSGVPADYKGAIPASYGNVGVTTTFAVGNYYGVSGVELDGASWDKYFDDDIELFFTNGKIDAAKVYEVFEKADVKFKVSYLGKNAKPVRTIPFKEYLANNAWYYGLSANNAQGINYVTMLEDLIVLTDEVGFMSNTGRPREPYEIGTTIGTITATKTQGNTSVLVYGKDPDRDESWRIRLAYSPWNFDNAAAYTQFWVPIPLYLLDDIAVRKVGLGPVTMFGTNTPRSFKALVNVDARQSEFEAIKGKWELVGTYVSGRAKATRVIPLKEEYFYAGYYGASVAAQYKNSTNAANGWKALNDGTAVPGTTGYDVFHPNTSYGPMTYDPITPTIASPGLTTYQLRSDFVLPLYYRSLNIIDDEGVLVDLFGEM